MSKLMSMYEDYDRAELSYPGGPVETMDCDIVVVGGGGSGMNVAVRASELGAKVGIVEKMDRLGGNSWLAGGLLSTTSKYQRELGFADQTDHYIETAHKFNRYLLDPAIFERYLRNSGHYLEWLVDKGLDIAVPKHYFPNDDPTQKPVVNWRSAGELMYSNWLNYYVYQTTPYDLRSL